MKDSMDWIDVALILAVWATIAVVVALSVGRAVRLRERRESLRASDDDSFRIPGELDSERPSDQLD